MPESNELEQLLKELDLFESGEDAPSAEDMAEHWVERSVAALERWQALLSAGLTPEDEDPDLAEAAFDLLAVHSGLARLDRGLTAELGAIAKRLEAEIGKHSDSIVRLARVVPDPSAWLEDAADWSERSADPDNDPMEAARDARCLLSDLDDAQLVAHSIARLTGMPDEQLDDELATCTAFAVRNAIMFSAADVFVYRSADAMSRDLAMTDPELALTQVPFVHALRAIRDLSAEPQVIPVSESEAATWRAVAKYESGEARRERLERLKNAVRQLGDRVREAVAIPMLVPAFEPIAATGSDAAPRAEDVKRWRGVEGDWTALLNLRVPGAEPDDTEAVLRVTGARWGDRAVLQGIEKPLDCSTEGAGTAVFTLGELRAVQDDEIPTSLALIRADGETVDIGEPEGGELD